MASKLVVDRRASKVRALPPTSARCLDLRLHPCDSGQSQCDIGLCVDRFTTFSDSSSDVLQVTPPSSGLCKPVGIRVQQRRVI